MRQHHDTDEKPPCQQLLHAVLPPPPDAHRQALFDHVDGLGFDQARRRGVGDVDHPGYAGWRAGFLGEVLDPSRSRTRCWPLGCRARIPCRRAVTKSRVTPADTGRWTEGERSGQIVSMVELRPVKLSDAATVYDAWGRYPENFERLTARTFRCVEDAGEYLGALFLTPQSSRREGVLRNWVIYPALGSRAADNYSYVRIPGNVDSRAGAETGEVPSR
jgi:hypothetical protein